MNPSVLICPACNVIVAPYMTNCPNCGSPIVPLTQVPQSPVQPQIIQTPISVPQTQNTGRYLQPPPAAQPPQNSPKWDPAHINDPLYQPNPPNPPSPAPPMPGQRPGNVGPPTQPGAYSQPNYIPPGGYVAPSSPPSFSTHFVNNPSSIGAHHFPNSQGYAKRRNYSIYYIIGGGLLFASKFFFPFIIYGIAYLFRR